MALLDDQRLTRRAVLIRLNRLAGFSTAVTLLAACSPSTPPTPPGAAPSTVNAPPVATSSPPVAPRGAQPTPAGPQGAPAAAATPGQQLMTIGIGALPKSLDPDAEAGSHANAVYPLLYDSLVKLDDQGNATPGLAESWQAIDDTTWQFKLRKGVTFHNGEPFTAASAKFTLDRIADAKQSVWSGRFDLQSGVDAVDDNTLNVRSKAPWALLPKTSYVAAMLPAQYFQQKGDVAFAKSPVGTGPFKFKEWQQDNYVSVEANPGYWGGAPKLQFITVRAYPEASTLVAALEKGELDIAYNLPPDDVARLNDKGFNIISRSQGTSMVCLLRSTQGGPLASKEVRQALNYAIDKDAIVAKLLGGYGHPLDGQFVGSEAFGYNPNVKAYPYDPAKARALLAQAGYPDGFKITMSGVAGRFLRDKEVSEAVQAELADVGVQVDLQILESAVWFDQYTKGTSGPIILNSIAWAPLMDADQGIQILLGDSVRNLLKNDPFDALYHQEQSTLDTPKRQQLLFDIQQLLHDEAALLFLFQFPGIYGVGKRVQNADFTGYLAMKNLLTMSVA